MVEPQAASTLYTVHRVEVPGAWTDRGDFFSYSDYFYKYSIWRTHTQFWLNFNSCQQKRICWELLALVIYWSKYFILLLLTAQIVTILILPRWKTNDIFSMMACRHGCVCTQVHTYLDVYMWLYIFLRSLINLCFNFR